MNRSDGAGLTSFLGGEQGFGQSVQFALTGRRHCYLFPTIYDPFDLRCTADGLSK